MNNNTFIQNLIIALDDADVIKKIGVIMPAGYKHTEKIKPEMNNNDQIKEYAEKLKNLADQNIQLKTEADSLRQTTAEINRSIVDFKSENEKLKAVIEKKEAEILKHNLFFEEAKTHYEKYCELNNSVKKPLQGVFKDKTAETFICSGVQWENLEAFWDFLQTQVCLPDPQGGTKVLVDIFKYFFSLYCSIQGRSIYKIQSVLAGAIFDEDKHSRASKSSVRGKISEVLLPGYINVRTGKIIKKSIVRIK